MLGVITNLVMCSRRNFNSGRVPVYEVCADGPSRLEKDGN
jgi:hypothetical protein